MRKQLGLYSVAFTALMLAITPAGAISLNIGGDGGLVSVDSGNSGSGGDTGASSSDDDLLNLGGKKLLDLSGDDDADAAVEIDLGVQGSGSDGGVLGDDGIVDLDTGGDDGVIIDLFGPEKALADVELGLGGDDGVGDDGLLDLDTGGDSGVVLDLFGPGSAVADVELGLDGGSGLADDGLVDALHGSGSAAGNHPR